MAQEKELKSLSFQGLDGIYVIPDFLRRDGGEMIGNLIYNILIAKEGEGYGSTFPPNPTEGQIFFKKI